jgi:hypothetical protein
MIRLATLTVAACVLFTGCAEPKSFLVHRPEDKTVDVAVTEMWTSEIASTARDGDWILSRSYYAIADAVSQIAPGEELSHASIYDAKRGTIIEAVNSGVREIPLADLVQRNHYMIIVRPRYTTAAEGTANVARARSALGTPFDHMGFFGLQSDKKFYCSELVWWASQGEAKNGVHETIITPANLMQYGEVIYWTGKRNDAQVQALAMERSSEAQATITRTAAR